VAQVSPGNGNREGAPSLRFLQGREAVPSPHEILLLCTVAERSARSAFHSLAPAPHPGTHKSGNHSIAIARAGLPIPAD